MGSIHQQAILDITYSSLPVITNPENCEYLVKLQYMKHSALGTLWVWVLHPVQHPHGSATGFDICR